MSINVTIAASKIGVTLNQINTKVLVSSNQSTQVITVHEGIQGIQGEKGAVGPSGLPSGGNSGEVLIKQSATPGDVSWGQNFIDIANQNLDGGYF